MMTGVGRRRACAAARATSSGSGVTRVRVRPAGVLAVTEDHVEREVEEDRAAVRGERGDRGVAHGRPTSSVAVTVAACLVTGATSGTWSISCRLPAPQRNWAPVRRAPAPARR
jgi:hypothetical protein